MMERTCDAFANVKLELEDMVKSFRDASPAHYTFKIQSFSLVSENSIQKYESNVFESGGYKWKLLFYPNGNEKMNVKNHISLYLVLSETDSLHPGWEVNATFKLFLFDQIRDRYLVVEHNGKLVRRFHVAKTEWGFSKFIPLAAFNDPSNGDLLNDTCLFGAEVFVHNSTGHGECLSMTVGATTSSYTWKMDRFSELKNDNYRSEIISAQNHKWNIQLFPKGDLESKNKFLSLYVRFDDLASTRNRIYAKYSLRVMDQFYGKHIQNTATEWFDSTNQVFSWGWTKFLDLNVLNDPAKGFLRNDRLIIEADVTILGSVNSFK